MNTAKRLYGKVYDPYYQTIQQQSPFFRSKVNRKVNQIPQNQLGPGQYQISLPLVKPNFQTIRKNNNTLIVKFNNNISSAFHSKSPRFYYPEEKYSYEDKFDSRDREIKGQYQANKQQWERKYNNTERIQQDKSNLSDNNKELQQTLMISQMNENMQKGVNKKTLSYKKGNLSKKKSKKNLFSYKGEQKKQNNNYNEQKQQISHRTLPISQRLHHLQPNLIQKKKLNSQRYNSENKSTQWSKYKQIRKSFVQTVNNYQSNPGPGSYKLKKPLFKNYNQMVQITSWQFNSKTSRNPFNQIKKLQNQNQNQNSTTKQGNGLNSLNHVNNVNNGDNVNNMRKQMFLELMPDEDQMEIKRKIFNKKRSKRSISNFHTSQVSKIQVRDIDLSVQFTAIHSRQNLFVDDKRSYSYRERV